MNCMDVPFSPMRAVAWPSGQLNFYLMRKELQKITKILINEELKHNLVELFWCLSFTSVQMYKMRSRHATWRNWEPQKQWESSHWAHWPQSLHIFLCAMWTKIRWISPLLIQDIKGIQKNTNFSSTVLRKPVKKGDKWDIFFRSFFWHPSRWKIFSQVTSNNKNKNVSSL